jgi:hypothetical protein
MCLEAAKKVGRNDLVEELEKLLDHEYWMKYAVNQIELVQERAKQFSGVQIHSWPDRELVDSTTGELQRKLQSMRDSISQEHFSEVEIIERNS